MDIDRKDFLVYLAGGTATLLTASCGGGGYGGGSTAATTYTCTPTITPDHGHALTIPANDILFAGDPAYGTAGTADHTYDIGMAADGHTHTVFFSNANLILLKQGQTVPVTSSTDPSMTFGNHAHAITQHCV